MRRKVFDWFNLYQFWLKLRNKKVLTKEDWQSIVSRADEGVDAMIRLSARMASGRLAYIVWQVSLDTRDIEECEKRENEAKRQLEKTRSVVQEQDDILQGVKQQALPTLSESQGPVTVLPLPEDSVLALLLRLREQLGYKPVRQKRTWSGKPVAQLPQFDTRMAALPDQFTELVARAGNALADFSEANTAVLGAQKQFDTTEDHIGIYYVAIKKYQDMLAAHLDNPLPKNTGIVSTDPLMVALAELNEVKVTRQLLRWDAPEEQVILSESALQRLLDMTRAASTITDIMAAYNGLQQELATQVERITSLNEQIEGNKVTIDELSNKCTEYTARLECVLPPCCRMPDSKGDIARVMATLNEQCAFNSESVTHLQPINSPAPQTLLRTPSTALLLGQLIERLDNACEGLSGYALQYRNTCELIERLSGNIVSRSVLINEVSDVNPNSERVRWCQLWYGDLSEHAPWQAIKTEANAGPDQYLVPLNTLLGVVPGDRLPVLKPLSTISAEKLADIKMQVQQVLTDSKTFLLWSQHMFQHLARWEELSAGIETLERNMGTNGPKIEEFKGVLEESEDRLTGFISNAVHPQTIKNDRFQDQLFVLTQLNQWLQRKAV